MTAKQIVERLDKLERQVADLRRHASIANSRGKTWRDYIGMFHNDRDFEEAMAFGRAYRRSTMPQKRRKP